ncbi:hypothetical protein J6590_033878 [Homalodisca vitripennis]|nr:hypothetical protein J6590_033878 [Homalodisca vitripennis]
MQPQVPPVAALLRVDTGPSPPITGQVQHCGIATKAHLSRIPVTDSYVETRFKRAHLLNKGSGEVRATMASIYFRAKPERRGQE